MMNFFATNNTQTVKHDGGGGGGGEVAQNHLQCRY